MRAEGRGCERETTLGKRKDRALAGRDDERILAKAFRGELVPQDPGDEPASVLLERIRAEQAAVKAERARRSGIS